ncbi:MAG: helix-turn-helix transcriptional regulator, partial [Anaerolineae bacterium]|nr:helix-turn-helix transcriptional regulator [Anaerolineae bacterium]
VCLVLDNYEVLTSPEVHRTVAFLLENLPGSSRLLISSRNAVKLPVARLRAQNQLLELRDLNFTLEETACFLQEIMELPLNAQEVQTLHAVTEGWVAGLQLAAAALQAECCDLSKTIAAFKGDHRYVADYLSEEIFQNQPPDIQTFLLQTSLLSHLKADLCDAVVGISSSQMILEKLEAANLLVVPLDDRRQQYRYHCLFADFLRDRLRRDSTVRTTNLHRRAALWFEKNGHIDEAIDHALLGDSMLAARLIKAHAPGRLARGEVYTVKRWMSALPDSVPCEDIELSLVYAWALAHSGEWDKATQYLNRIESADPAVKGEIAAVNSRIGAILGNWQKIISCGEYALQHLPENMLSLRADILLNLGHAYLDSGDTNRAWEAFADAYRLSRTAGNPRVEVFSAYFIGRVR